MTHYLESLDSDKIAFSFEEFDAENIKQCIVNYFTFGDNKQDELWLYKVSIDKKTVGDTFIDTFVYKNGAVYKEVHKGNRTFYKKI
ncbi:MAG: hypothetical protein ACJAVA_000269 [Flavobacteriaceae bacterium]|jgi:hypothetical protein